MKRCYVESRANQRSWIILRNADCGIKKDGQGRLQYEDLGFNLKCDGKAAFTSEYMRGRRGMPGRLDQGL